MRTCPRATSVSSPSSPDNLCDSDRYGNWPHLAFVFKCIFCVSFNYIYIYTYIHCPPPPPSIVNWKHVRGLCWSDNSIYSKETADRGYMKIKGRAQLFISKGAIISTIAINLAGMSWNFLISILLPQIQQRWHWVTTFNLFGSHQALPLRSEVCTHCSTTPRSA